MQITELLGDYDIMSLLCYVFLAGSGLLKPDGGFRIRRFNSFHRDFILITVKKTLMEYLKEITFGEVPIKPI